MRKQTCLNCYQGAMGGNIGCADCNGEGFVEIGDEMTPEEMELVGLEKTKFEIVKPYYERREALITRLLIMFGIGHHFQDPVTGIVFRLSTVDGKWMPFTPFEIQRSRLKSEPKGSISVKDVAAMGYEMRMPESFDDDTRPVNEQLVSGIKTTDEPETEGIQINDGQGTSQLGDIKI